MRSPSYITTLPASEELGNILHPSCCRIIEIYYIWFCQSFLLYGIICVTLCSTNIKYTQVETVVVLQLWYYVLHKQGQILQDET